MAVPNIFATKTGPILLSELDTNFYTPITIGSTSIALGSTQTVISGVTLIAPALDTPASGTLTNCTFPQLLASTGSTLVSTIQSGTGTVTRTVASKLNDVISVKDFGAVGDGVTDDGPALNLALAYIRTYTSAEGAKATITLDLCGDTYLTTISLNATGIRYSWGWGIKNGAILGECTGNAVLDMIGSRGGYLEQLTVEGSSANMPSVGIQAARSSVVGYGFCDNMLFTAVNTLGWFSTAGVHFYGQETTTHEHCRYWNYNPNGYAAIHVGYSTIAMSSVYLAPITGATSFINNSYINCDYRYLPSGNITNITGISKATSAVVSVASHPFVNGDIVVIGLVNGMTQINNVKATVASAAPTSFVLTGVDSTAFSTYTSGGSAIKTQTVSTVLFSRGMQHRFENSYIVNYGTDAFQFDFPDTTPIYSIWLDFLFEGIGSRSHIRFTSVTTDRDVRDFRVNTYNSHCRDYLISSDNAATNKVVIYNGDISWTNIAYSAPTLLDVQNNFAFYAVDVAVPAITQFDYSTMATYTGTSTYVATGDYTLITNSFYNTKDKTYTPVVAATSGTITAYTASGTAKLIGNICFVNITVTVSNNGTGATTLNITLPYTAASNNVLTGRANVISGAMLQGTILSSATNVSVKTYNNTYPVATGETIYLSGFYLI